MKYLVTALCLGLLSISLVSAGARHAKRQGQYPREEEVMRNRKAHKCERGIYNCLEPVLKYSSELQSFNPDFVDAIVKVRDAGTAQVCSDLLDMGECIVSKLDYPECEVMRQYIKTELRKGLQFAHHVCGEKFYELDRHWNCLVNASMLDELQQQCKLEFRNAQLDCNPDLLVNCVANLYASNEGCEAGASEVIREIILGVFGITQYHRCPESAAVRPNQNLESLLSLLKKK